MLLLCSFIENVFQSLIDLKSLVLGSLDTNNTNIGCAWQFHLTLRSKHNYLLLNIIHTNIIALNSINFVVTLFSIKTKRSPILISFNYTRTYLWLNTYSRPMYRPHIIYFTNCTCFFFVWQNLFWLCTPAAKLPQRDKNTLSIRFFETDCVNLEFHYSKTVYYCFCNDFFYRS